MAKHLSIRLLPLLLCITPLLAAEFPMPLPGNDAIGEIHTATARYEDTLSDIARTSDLGYLEIADANPGVDPWLPREGLEIVLPTQFLLPQGSREGIVINLPELRIYYYPKGENRVITHPLGIGREGWSTPTGLTRVTGKRADPSWTPPKSIRLEQEQEGGAPLPAVIPPGPDNPLGTHAIYLAMPGYLLHGTNKPYGVGMRVSHGCIRLYPEDIKSLFPRVPSGTPVRIIDEPYKIGWLGGRMYVEAHRPLSESLADNDQKLTPLRETILEQTNQRNLEPDWETFEAAILSPTGVPTPITKEP